MSSHPSGSDITVKVSYNVERYVPRNFFVHVHNIPEDTNVRIEYDGDEIPISRRDGYVRAGFWVANDKSIQLTLLQDDAVIASTEYLIHEGKVFEYAMALKRPALVQVATGTFG